MLAPPLGAWEGADMFWTMMRLQARRLVGRKEPWICLACMTALVCVSFVEGCLHFQGFDRAALPSAARGWIGYFEPLQIRSFGVGIYLLFFLISSSVFADCHYVARKSGISSHLIARCGQGPYIASCAVCTGIGGMLVLLIPLLLSQLLAFTLFPIESGPYAFSSWFGTPASNLADARTQVANALIPEMMVDHPYLYNMMFIVYASLWGGIMALVSFSASFIIRRNRLAVLGFSTLFYLISLFLLPRQLSLSFYLYPCVLVSGLSVLFFVIAPLFVLGACTVFLVRCARCEDVAI